MEHSISQKLIKFLKYFTLTDNTNLVELKDNHNRSYKTIISLFKNDHWESIKNNADDNLKAI